MSKVKFYNKKEKKNDKHYQTYFPIPQHYVDKKRYKHQLRNYCNNNIAKQRQQQIDIQEPEPNCKIIHQSGVWIFRSFVSLF